MLHVPCPHPAEYGRDGRSWSSHLRPRGGSYVGRTGLAVLSHDTGPFGLALPVLRRLLRGSWTSVLLKPLGGDAGAGGGAVASGWLAAVCVPRPPAASPPAQGHLRRCDSWKDVTEVLSPR